MDDGKIKTKLNIRSTFEFLPQSVRVEAIKNFLSSTRKKDKKEINNYDAPECDDSEYDEECSELSDLIDNKVNRF